MNEQKPETAAAPAAPAAAAPAPASADKITIDDFMKVELRVAKVLAAEKVANSRKLVKLTIDVGTEQRTLVAGIAQSYEPDALVGRTIVMVFNPQAGEAHGDRIERHGPGGEPRRRQADARHLRPGGRAGNTSEMKRSLKCEV